MGLEHYSHMSHEERNQWAAVNLAAQLVLDGGQSVDELCRLCVVNRDDVEREIKRLSAKRAHEHTLPMRLATTFTQLIRSIRAKSMRLLRGLET